MKFIRIFFVALIGFGAFALVGKTAVADTTDKPAAIPVKAPAGQLFPVTEKDAAWVAKEKAAYPTNMCLISGEKVGSNSDKPTDFIYRQEGKPDRLVSFCCPDCAGDFAKDPAKYLKIIDDAAAAKAKAGK